ncbi:MAG TPA: hypothetical protein VIK93_01330 [Limnochordales bacterium]
MLPLRGHRLMAVSLDVPAYTVPEEKLHSLGRMLVEKTVRISGTVMPGGPARPAYGGGPLGRRNR